MVPDFSSSQRGYQEGVHLGGTPAEGMSPESTQPADGLDFNNFILEIEPEPASPEAEPVQTKPESNPNLQVQFKSEGGRLLLILPPAPEKSRNPVYWEELRRQLKERISGGERFLQPHTPVHLIARDRLLDSQQVQEIDSLLSDAQLPLKRIYASRRQTAVAAATAGYSVEQQTTLSHLGQGQEASRQAMDEPLYLQTTLRSGVEVRHRGTVIVLGDANPGSSIVAEGDIFIWGHARGVVHAGAGGNTQCRIMALHMQPTQLRIADKVARSPDDPPAQYQPEVAYIGPDGIRIALAAEFALADLTIQESPQEIT
ncbi:MAG: septum site-determining protein MinC [Phormidesmis sp.]